MATYDPRFVRPRRDWCVVLMDERKVQISGIFLPTSETGVEKVTEGVATIIRVGAGEMNEALGLKPGQRVCLRSYFKYANPIPADEEWPSGAHKEYLFVSSKDLQAIVEPGVEVGVFSRPSQHAVDSVSEDGTVTMSKR